MSARKLRRGRTLHVLFVCTGNICRSPLAERLAQAFAEELSIEGLTVSSAGVRAVVGAPIHPFAAQILEGLGGSSSGFTARQLKPKMAFDADLVLTMTRPQREVVLEFAPRQLKRSFILSEASQLATMGAARHIDDLHALRPRLTADQLVEIPDPIGRDMECFKSVASQIADLLPPILRLCRRA